jgi:Ca-activated chloride channel family protein
MRITGYVAPLLTSAALLLPGAGPAARQQTPFRSATRTVAVYATVTDAAGRLVPDLAREDFEVSDNGRVQPLTVFASEIQPITVVMMLDRSGSMRANFRIVEAAAEQFVVRLLPSDKARIGSFSDRIQVDPRGFTSDQGELIGILRTELQEAGPTPLWNAVNVAMTALLRQDGRRVVLVFTDGGDSPRPGANNVTLKAAMRRAQEEDVMVCAIGLAGRGFSGRSNVRGRFGGRGMRRGASEQKPDPGLARIAAETGGGYFELTTTDDLAATFERVADELHRQYALGFELPAADGKTHKLDVRVKRDGMTVRARRSYVAPRPRSGRP